MLVNYVALLPEAVLTAGVLLAVLVRFLRSANIGQNFSDGWPNGRFCRHDADRGLL